MEDAFSACDVGGPNQRATLVCVFDGHGGTRAVDLLAVRFGKIFDEEYSGTRMSIDRQSNGRMSDRMSVESTSGVVDVLLSTFKRAETEVMNKHFSIGGSTICACLFSLDEEHPTLYCAHLGDTRAVLCRGGLAVRLTSMSDHKATDTFEKARIEKSGNSVSNDRVGGMLAISRAFGDAILKDIRSENEAEKIPCVLKAAVTAIPDITATRVFASEDAFVIVGCDGLFDVVSDQEAVNLVSECLANLVDLWDEKSYGPWNAPVTAQLLARCLVEEALARGSLDNVTCAIVFF